MDSLVEPEDRLREQYLSAPWGELGRTATLAAVSLLSKFLLGVLNTTTVENLATFQQQVQERPEGVGLITVSNHTSTLDDPALLSAMLPWSFYLTEHKHHGVRWSLCAREICYRNPVLAAFFKSGKTLPIERGAGPAQPVMRVAAAEVARGGWVHLFPEGRVVYTGQLAPSLRWGIGKIVCDAVTASGRVPTVLPFYHSGMGRVMPRGARMPRAGHAVAVLVGEPVDLSELAAGCAAQGDEQRCAWRDIAERIAAALRALEARAPANPDQSAVLPRRGGEGGRRSEGALPASEGEA